MRVRGQDHVGVSTQKRDYSKQACNHTIRPQEIWDVRRMSHNL